MENASKALMIAGGVLIALMIITLLVYMFTSMSDVFKSEDEIKRIEELEAYNKEYESYNRKLLRGADIISLMNKAISNNKKYEDVLEEYRMQIEFIMKEEIVYTKTGKSNTGKFEVGKTYNIESFASIRNNQEAFNDFKRRVFDCTGTEYNELGRICKMKFTERKVDYTEGF
ncbi:MAG: hypothetical protein HFJ57_02665 [Clostridia bacterium]|nr:hypothetical protein [Clostridia bacterium]